MMHAFTDLKGQGNYRAWGDFRKVSQIKRNKRFAIKSLSLSYLAKCFTICSSGSGGGSNVIFLAIFKLHARMVTMSKSMKNIQVNKLYD